jgi:hypothetical protein
MRSASHFDKLKKVRIDEAEVEPLKPLYEASLKELKKHFERPEQEWIE